MGTPGFAVASLALLVEAGYNIVGVITAPDKPAGRGRQLMESPVKQYAASKGLKVLQPTNLKSEGFLDELRALKADLQVVVAFRMLPEAVWNMPPEGTVNLHASLLPQYRGAAPVNWAVINGEQETGVTTFFITHEIDTGDLIYQRSVPIREDETAGELHDKLMEEGADLVLKTVEAIEKGENPRKPQLLKGALKKAPKIFKEDCRIDWQQPLENIYNFIRGLSPYPAAWTALDGKMFKIYKAEKKYAAHSQHIPAIETDGNTYFKIAVSGGYLELKQVQLEGKKPMAIEAFLKGFRSEENLKLD